MYFADLLVEYKQLLQQMRSEGVTSGDLYSEVKQAIAWMETGYDPAEYRAATRVDAYPMDPYHMQTFMAYVNDEDMLIPEFLKPVKEKIESETAGYFDGYSDVRMKLLNREISEANERKAKINGALKGLTKDERAVYVAIEAELMPFSKVAKMLDVSKGTVQSYYKRACSKIAQNRKKGTQTDIFDFVC